MKLLKEKYKTFDGALKRCGFENGVAKGEFERGDKARHYRYTIMQEGDVWRVARSVKPSFDQAASDLRAEKFIRNAE